MASKTGLEYDVRGVDIDTKGKWREVYLKIKQVCEDMNKSGGWALASTSWPKLEHAVLVFTRPAGSRKSDVELDE